MSKILGKYILRASLEDFTTGFTFSGANRNTRLNVSDDVMLSFDCSDLSDGTTNSDLSFNSNAILKIRRARIITTGAVGLRSAVGGTAARLFLTAHDANDTASDEIGTMCLMLDEYNVWSPVNIDFIPKTHANDNYFLAADKTVGLVNTFLSIDDFNIQNDYIGETFKPYLELEVDTAGMYNTSMEIV